MKQFLLAAAMAAVCFPTIGAAANVDATRPGARQEAFRFMPEVKTPHVFGVSDDADAGAKIKAAASLVSQSLPEGDEMGFLETPDGETWCYVAQFTKNSNSHIEHFSFTIYDSAFNEVTTIEDDTELAENEVRLMDIQLGGLVTKKFFNNDDKPEFMIAFVANTTEYVNHFYTKVYSQGVDEPVANFEGYWCTDVNTSTDSWSENFYIGFYTEQNPEQTEIGGIINTVDYVIDIYKKAGYSTPCEQVLEIRTPGLLVTGESWIPVLATAHDGTACFAANYLKYSFFEEPYNFNNETPTADNEFIIDYYEVPRYGTPSLVAKTTIPTVCSASNLNYYYLGALLFDDDITYGRYTSDDAPAFTVTRAHYETSSDDYSYTYEVYPAGSEETPATEKLLTLGENVESATMMSDVRGYDPQVMFIKNVDEEYSFEFVNLITGEVEATLPYYIAENVTMNASTDRVAGEGSPLYVVSQYTAESDEEGNAIQVIAYINPDGTLHHTDRLNLGQNVAFAEVNNNAYTLDPYIFNTDSDREYMVLVKRFLDESGSSTREEFMVISPSKGALLTLLPDDELGNLAFIQLEEKSQNLYIIYQTPGYRYNTVRYELPFEKFAGGDGSAENPYQIATLGDMRQVKFSPASSYVLVNDLDARGVGMECVTGDFTGTFDGQGHNIIGPELDGQGIFARVTGDESQSTGGEVKNLNIIAPKIVVADYSETGIVVNEALGAKISNVVVYDAEVEGETPEASATFGGIVGSAAVYTEISESAVFGAEINLPESSVGGIAGKIMTSTAVKACVFKGNITGGTTVGGIVGSTNTVGDRIEDCHVDAVIVAKNTIGGVAGSSSRGVMQRCHVEGSIEATEAPMWGGGASTGGLIGELETDWAVSAEDTPVIKDNFINLTSLTSFEPDGEPYYEGEYDTFHRVVGKTCANEEPEPIYDDDWSIIGYEDALVEAILADNYVIDGLARISEEIADDAATTEGKSVAADELGKEFFEGLGFAFGYELSAPWNNMSPASPSLYFEAGMILFDQETYEVAVDAEAEMVIGLFGEAIDDDTLGSFLVDIADEGVAEFVDLSVAGDKILLVVKGLKAGETAVVANYNGKITKATVKVVEESGVCEVKAEASLSIEYRGGVVMAEGCMIEVYSTSGAKVLGGVDTCDLGRLAGGVYVVSATDKSGRRTAVKVMR